MRLELVSPSRRLCVGLVGDLIYAQRGGNNELFMPIYGCQAGLHVNWQKHTSVLETSGRKSRGCRKLERFSWPVFDFWQHLSPSRSRNAVKCLNCVYPDYCERKLACSHFCNICRLEIKIKFCMSLKAAQQKQQ